MKTYRFIRFGGELGDGLPEVLDGGQDGGVHGEELLDQEGVEGLRLGVGFVPQPLQELFHPGLLLVHVAGRDTVNLTGRLKK